MSKFLATLIEIVFWIQIFLSPFLIFSIPATLLYLNNKDYLILSISLVVIGSIIGVFVAERIRKKYGCSTFMGKLLSLGNVGKRNKSND